MMWTKCHFLHSLLKRDVMYSEPATTNMSHIRFTLQYIDFVMLYNVWQENWLQSSLQHQCRIYAGWCTVDSCTAYSTDLDSKPFWLVLHSKAINANQAVGCSSLMWLLRFQSSCCSLRGVDPLLFLLFWLHPPLYRDHPSIDPHQVHFHRLLHPIIQTLRKWSLSPKVTNFKFFFKCSVPAGLLYEEVALNRDIKQLLDNIIS